MRRSGLTTIAGTLLALLAAGCDTAPATEEPPAAVVPPVSEWAVNVGGPQYQGGEGTLFEAERFVSGGRVDQMAAVKGSQDPTLYLGFRRGDVRIDRPFVNGRYDVTFYFAEPDDVEGGSRVLDALAEGETVIESLDVMSARDGKVKSALTVTVPGVEVSDGELNIALRASVSEPVLSGLSVVPAGNRKPAGELIWSDEFDYTGPPDPDKWVIDRWPARKVNDEDQAYTDREKNLRVEDGVLIIEAHLEDYDNAKYTSGRLHTNGKGDFLYGRVDIRAQVPRGKGTWAAGWMLPSDPFRYATLCSEGEWQGNPDCDAWPNSGEIDILEHVGYQMGHVHGTVHNKAYYWITWEQRKGRILLDGVDTSFKVYSLEWTPERIDMFVDDVHYFTYVNEGEGWEAWPYDHPFHVILNLAVGGYWGRAGGGIDDSIFPQRMLVDYVRVYAPE